MVHHLTRPASSNGIAQLPDHVGGPRVPVTHFDRVARVRPDLHSIDRPRDSTPSQCLFAHSSDRFTHLELLNTERQTRHGAAPHEEPLSGHLELS